MRNVATKEADEEGRLELLYWDCPTEIGTVGQSEGANYVCALAQ